MTASNSTGARQVARLIRRNKWPKPATFLQVGVGVARELKTFTVVWPECRFIGCEPAKHWLKDPWNGVGYPGLLLPIAVGAQNGTATFYERRRHRAASGLYKGNHLKNYEYEVTVRTLDTIYGEHGPFDNPVFLWLDCEGSEVDAIRGGMAFMRRVKYVNVEVQRDFGKVVAEREKEILDHLPGFEVVAMHSIAADKYDLFLARL